MFQTNDLWCGVRGSGVRLIYMLLLLPLVSLCLSFFYGIAALVSSIERRHKWLIENGWHATKIPGEIVAITRYTFQQTEPTVRPLPPPLDRSQLLQQEDKWAEICWPLYIIIHKRGCVIIGIHRSGCLEFRVNNSGHYWLHNYKMLLQQKVSSFILVCKNRLLMLY